MTPATIDKLRADFEDACAALPLHERPDLSLYMSGTEYFISHTDRMFRGWCLAHTWYCEGEATGPGDSAS